VPSVDEVLTSALAQGWLRARTSRGPWCGAASSSASPAFCRSVPADQYRYTLLTLFTDLYYHYYKL